MKQFFAFLVFRLLPKPRYRFWLPQRGADYALFHHKCKALALQWVKEQHMALDDEYRWRVCFEEKPSATFADLQQVWTNSFAKRYPNFANPTHRLEHVSFWQQRAAAMAGHMPVATPGEVFSRLHGQTEDGMRPFFKQASDALDKAGL